MTHAPVSTLFTKRFLQQNGTLPRRVVESVTVPMITVNVEIDFLKSYALRKLYYEADAYVIEHYGHLSISYQDHAQHRLIKDKLISLFEEHTMYGFSPPNRFDLVVNVQLYRIEMDIFPTDLPSLLKIVEELMSEE